MDFDIDIQGDNILVNGEPVSWDIQPVGKDSYHVLLGQRSFDIHLSDIDQKNKQYTITVNGRKYPVKVSDELDALLLKMGMGGKIADTMGDVKSPMPGLVINILVAEGDTFQKGDSLIVLEAMKMENVIKASGAGVVKSVKVKKRDAVEKNQLLIEVA
jgi:biotin carboxyl carrier protein